MSKSQKTFPIRTALRAGRPGDKCNKELEACVAVCRTLPDGSEKVNCNLGCAGAFFDCTDRGSKPA